MRALVTGAAGFVGSHLTEALLERGHDAVGLDCLTDYYDPALKEENARGFPLERLDLAADPLDLAGYDVVFHLAGQPGVRSFGDVFELYLRRNLLATQRVLEAAVAAGTRVVFTSSSSIYGDAERYPTPEEAEPRPRSPYGITKLGCEQLISAYAKSFGLDAVVLRYFTVYGPRQRRTCSSRGSSRRSRRAGASSSTARASSRGASPTSATRSRRRSRPRRRRAGALYNVGGGEEASVLEAIALLERIAGRTLHLERTARRGRRRQADEGRREPDRRRARLGAADVARGRLAGAVGVGGG